MGVEEIPFFIIYILDGFMYPRVNLIFKTLDIHTYGLALERTHNFFQTQIPILKHGIAVLGHSYMMIKCMNCI